MSWPFIWKSSVFFTDRLKSSESLISSNTWLINAKKTNTVMNFYCVNQITFNCLSAAEWVLGIIGNFNHVVVYVQTGHLSDLSNSPFSSRSHENPHFTNSITFFYIHTLWFILRLLLFSPKKYRKEWRSYSKFLSVTN